MSGESETVDCDGEISCNLDNVFLNLKNGLVDEDDVDLAAYISAYKELYNFFVLLGGAFQFIASDVKSKIKIIEDFQSDEKKKYNEVKNFSTVKKMIFYEKNEKLLDNPKYVSCSRTLLRLHRGMDFLRHFFKEICDLQNDEKIGNVCRETYDKTLACYHTWVVKNSARLAMKLLPTKETLLVKMSKDKDEDKEKALAVMPDLLELMKTIYERVQKLYQDNDLLNLP